jgi:hypothetical protein
MNIAQLRELDREASRTWRAQNKSWQIEQEEFWYEKDGKIIEPPVIENKDKARVLGVFDGVMLKAKLECVGRVMRTGVVSKNKARALNKKGNPIARDVGDLFFYEWNGIRWICINDVGF